VQFTGDTTLTATPTAAYANELILPGGATASAEVEWDGATNPDDCAGYASAVVTAPDGGTVYLPLDPPAHVCDANTLVVHPLIAG
jgi:hypothetical protein